MAGDEHGLYPGLRVTIDGERRRIADACGVRGSARHACARLEGDPPTYLRTVPGDGPLARSIEVVTLLPGGGEPPSAGRFGSADVAQTRNGPVLQDAGDGRTWPVRSVHRTTYDALDPAGPPIGANLATLRLVLGLLAAVIVFAWIVGVR